MLPRGYLFINDLGGVRFGIDGSTGEYGYKKVGADTIYPFSAKTVHTGTYTLTSSGTTDLGSDHTYRYINASGIAGSCDLLWTNPDNSVDFIAQTVSLNLTNYDAIVLLLANGLNQSPTMDSVAADMVQITYYIWKNTTYTVMTTNYRYIMYRNVTVSNTGVTFGTGYMKDWAQEYGTRNMFTIPYKIFGLKHGGAISW